MRRVDKLKANWIKTEHENAPQVEAQQKSQTTNEPITKRTNPQARLRLGERERETGREREREIVQSAPFQCTRHTAAVDWNTNWKQQLNAQQTRKERERGRNRGKERIGRKTTIRIENLECRWISYWN